MGESKQYGSASGEGFMYAIEARSTFMSAEKASGLLLDNRWVSIPIHKITTEGIESQHAYPRGVAHELHLVDQTAAMALAWQFLSRAPLCCEARVVRVKVKWDYSAIEDGVSQPVSRKFNRDVEFVDRDTP